MQSRISLKSQPRTMRRTAETTSNHVEGETVDVDTDVESASLLANPVDLAGAPAPAAAAPSPSRLARWLQLTLVMLLVVSAASVFLYKDNLDGLNNNLNHVNDEAALQAAVKSVPTLRGALIPQATDKKRFAYMFYVTSDIYGCAALHLMDNLVNTVKMDTSRIDLVVLHSPAVSEHTLSRIQAAVDVRLIPVDSIRADVSEPTWLESLTKFNAFREWGYDRVVFMDADSVPMQNLDHLFDLPSAPLYAPTAYWLKQPFFASTVLVIEPSNAVFDAIIAWARQRGSAAGFDMDILNVYFRSTVSYLPGDYVVLNSDFRAKPDAQNKLYKSTTELKQHVKVVHFSCKPDGSYGKPWSAGTHDLSSVKDQGFDPLFTELYEAFWKTQADKC